MAATSLNTAVDEHTRIVTVTTSMPPMRALERELDEIYAKCALQPFIAREQRRRAAEEAQQRQFRTAHTIRPAGVRSQGGKLQPHRLAGSHSSNFYDDPVEKKYRGRIAEAHRKRHIFTVMGNFPVIKSELLKRGWLQKFPPNHYPSGYYNLTDSQLLVRANAGNEFEAQIISKALRDAPAYFVWQPRSSFDIYAHAYPYRNRIRRQPHLDFTNKVGLIGCAEQQNKSQDATYRISHPRFFRLFGADVHFKSFRTDFCRTQCLSVLRFLRDNKHNLANIIVEESAKTNDETIDFAFSKVRQLLEDDPTLNFSKNHMFATELDAEWRNFLLHARDIVCGKTKLDIRFKAAIAYAEIAKVYIDNMEKLREQLKWDGFRNLWILKPGHQCRGQGIFISNDLKEIMLHSRKYARSRYIVQKYVERPLLIYNTKFDIRQYMLLTVGATTLTIWFYNDCYLRFSSREFQLNNLHCSIHLTNNSVQKHFKNQPNRSPLLPACNMWSLEQFKSFLAQRKEAANVWPKIKKSFRQNIIAATMASVPGTQFVKNSFELYGVDFMLDEDYNAIMIEINATPDLSRSTPVTADICPRAQADLIKVVVDYAQNNKMPTGLFEKIYEVDYKQLRMQLLTEKLEETSRLKLPESEMEQF